MNHSQDQQAGLLPRLTALLCDAVLVTILLLIAATSLMAILSILTITGVISYAPYPSITNLLMQHPLWSPIFTLYLAIVWVGFYVYFWITSGQTFGMKVAQLKLCNTDGSSISITQALIRLATAGLGLGNFTVPIDPNKRSFQDMWAQTEMIKIHQIKKATTLTEK